MKRTEKKHVREHSKNNGKPEYNQKKLFFHLGKDYLTMSQMMIRRMVFDVNYLEVVAELANNNTKREERNKFEIAKPVKEVKETVKNKDKKERQMRPIFLFFGRCN